jgi:Ca2+-binding EF-hand superfamily protein
LDDDAKYQIKHRLAAAGYNRNGVDWDRLFSTYDRHSRGGLNHEEFRRALRRDGKLSNKQSVEGGVTDDQLDEVFDEVDTNGDDLISKEEFVAWMGGNYQPTHRVRKARVRGPSSDYIERMKRQLHAAAFRQGGVDWPGLFHFYDRDNSGGLKFSEFLSAVRRDCKVTKNECPDAEVRTLFNDIGDGNAEIDVGMFMEWIGVENAAEIAATVPAKPAHHDTTMTPKRKIDGGPHLPTYDEFVVIRRKLTAAAYSVGGVDWPHLFDHYDTDSSGGLALHEFQHIIRKDAKVTEIMMSNESVELLWNSIDKGSNGEIELEQFLAWLEVPAASRSSPTRSANTSGSGKKGKRKGKSKGRRADDPLPAPASQGYQLEAHDEDEGSTLSL